MQCKLTKAKQVHKGLIGIVQFNEGMSTIAIKVKCQEGAADYRYLLSAAAAVNPRVLENLLAAARWGRSTA